MLVPVGHTAFNLFFTLPMTTFTYAIASTSLKSELNIQSKKMDCVGSTLASLDLCMNLIGILAPLWRVVIFRALAPRGDTSSIDVVKFGWAVVVHWVAAIFLLVLLSKINVVKKKTKEKKA